MSMKFIDIESLRVCGIFPVGKEPSIRTLRSWTKWGILPHYKIGHFVYYDEKEVTDHFGMKFKVPIVDIHKLRARAELARAELATEREKVTMLLSDAYALTKNWHDRAESAEREVERLRAGIAECLHTNGHLADGEDCTLIGLKRCLRDPNAARESNGGAA